MKVLTVVSFALVDGKRGIRQAKQRGSIRARHKVFGIDKSERNSVIRLPLIQRSFHCSWVVARTRSTSIIEQTELVLPTFLRGIHVPELKDAVLLLRLPVQTLTDRTTFVQDNHVQLVQSGQTNTIVPVRNRLRNIHGDKELG